jgi:zinc/manganese transport system ATP-binding protein
MRNGPGRDDNSTVPAVSVQQASMRFGDRTLWSGLDLDIASGEFVAVLGPNGSGKTTLLRALLGLAQGRIFVAGRPA